MKNFIHLVIVSIIAFIFVFLHIPLQTLFVHELFIDIAFNVYFGWFSWLRLIYFLIFTLTGFLAGLCIAMLIPSNRKYLWASIGGILMMLIHFSLIKVAVSGEGQALEYFLIYSRSIMFLLGSIIGAFTLIKARKKLTSH